jgi:MFS family permease
MCVSQPILAGLADVFGRTSVVLASTLMFGFGSLVGADADSITLLLFGRSLQGLGAGGLTVLSYVTFGDMERKAGLKFLTSISISIAAGTVCGPIIGAGLSNGTDWVRSPIEQQSVRLMTEQALDLSP